MIEHLVNNLSTEHEELQMHCASAIFKVVVLTYQIKARVNTLFLCSLHIVFLNFTISLLCEILLCKNIDDPWLDFYEDVLAAF